VSVSRADCRCCRDLGALPGDFVTDAFGRVVSQATPGTVIAEMCDQCVAGAFLGGTHPHAMTGAKRSLREAGFLLPSDMS
jgi:hypothetical protein